MNPSSLLERAKALLENRDSAEAAQVVRKSFTDQYGEAVGPAAYDAFLIGIGWGGGEFKIVLPKLISEIESLRAQVEKMREALELALSLCPKGPVYDGMDPTFYHTLNYKDECKLQERIDAARDLLATLKASGEGE